MKKTKEFLVVVLVLACFGIVVYSCTGDDDDGILPDDDGLIPDDFCGPCGSVKFGDGSISGDAALDGFFKAVGSLDATFGKINDDFEADVRALAAAFDVEGAGTMEIGALIDATVLAIQTELNASIEGGVSAGLKINYVPPKCEVNVQASFEAQAQCEAKAGCSVDVECEPGKLSFECSGECHGGCEGQCSVPKCTVEMNAELACSGECSGQCVAPSANVECSGTCKGTCNGDCSAHVENADGSFSCNGACNGTCEGECAAEVQGGSCEAKCEGECKAQVQTEAECSGELECHGQCTGSCSGGCDGEIKAPKCEGSVECEASAKCEAQASASASAEASCTPPSLDVQYSLAANIEADANLKAKFMGKLKAFKVHMIGILRGMANLKILFDAEAAAEIGIQPPTVTLKAAIEGIVSAGFEGQFDIALGKIPCIATALNEAVTAIGTLPGKMQATFSGQAKFSAILF